MRPSFAAALPLLLLLFAAVARAAPAASPALESFPCVEDEIAAVIMKTSVARDCKWLRLTERSDGGAPIWIAVVTLTPPGHDPAKPPTIFVHGGPGIGIVDDWQMLALMKVARENQVILFDQRGVGWSGPRLCGFIDEDDPSLDRLSAARLHDHMQSDLSKCLKELEGKHDLTAYGTQATVRDMEALRAALGIEKWNIYGASYGTTVTLAYMAAHPERTRAAVIDSVYPPEMLAFTSALPDFVATIDRLNALCAANAACTSQVGDLPRALDAALASLEAEPLALDITHPITYRRQTRYLTGSALMAILQSQLLSSGNWRLVPHIVRDARDRRASWLLRRATEDVIALAAGSSAAVWMATECRERAPFDDRTKLVAQAERWPALARASMLDTWFRLCDHWPVKDAAPAATPRDTAVPTLVVAGEWDPATPAVAAESTARILGARARYVLVPKTAHAPTFLNPCLEGVVARFLAAPERAVDAACVATEPSLTAHIIPLDGGAAFALLWPYSVASMIPAALIAMGVAATFWWPLAWLRSPAPLASSRWFVAAAAILIAWLAWFGFSLSSAGTEAMMWLSYGIPAEALPGYSLILLMPLAGLGGLAAWGGELMHGRIGAGQFLHRTLVASALTGAFVMLEAIGLIPQSADEVLADLARLARL